MGVGYGLGLGSGLGLETLWVRGGVYGLCVLLALRGR